VFRRKYRRVHSWVNRCTGAPWQCSAYSTCTENRYCTGLYTHACKQEAIGDLKPPLRTVLPPGEY